MNSTEHQESEFVISEEWSDSLSKDAVCILVSKDEEEQAFDLSYSFEYLGLLLELFPVFLKNFEFYSFEVDQKDQTGPKKVKTNIRQDEFLKEHFLTDLTELGQAIHDRISNWNKRYMGMSFNQRRLIVKS
jgi:hypothetical protein